MPTNEQHNKKNNNNVKEKKKEEERSMTTLLCLIPLFCFFVCLSTVLCSLPWTENGI